MFRIETEKEFLKAFRPRDRRVVELPKDIQFPLFVRDYLAWVEPAGTRVFLLFQGPESKQPTGIAFRRDQQGSKALLSRVCEWCHAYGSADQIGLLTTDVNSKRRVGVNLCLDLRCKERLESMTNLAGRSHVDLSKLLLDRMFQFASKALGMEAFSER